MTFANRLGITAITAMMLALFPPQSKAETIVNKSFSYFQIGGRTAEELDRELEKRGPQTKTSGSRHPGATQIKFGGDITYLPANGRCSVGEVKVTLKTKIILPRWKNRNRANRELGMIWDALSSDIKRHEERHAEIARQHARKLEQSLKRLRPARDCETLQAKVAELTERTVEEHDKAQIAFDRVEAVNFEDRLIRIIEYRSKGKNVQN
ncbi:MAG: peptidase [Shinella sp.]|nr:MAG: peptidase [Shinella sp.]